MHNWDLVFTDVDPKSLILSLLYMDTKCCKHYSAREYVQIVFL